MFLAVGEHILDEVHPQSKRMATLFGGGVGGCREELCGALSGAILAMSALLGRTDCKINDKPEMALAKGYRERFLAEFGHTICAPLRDQFNPDGKGSCRLLVEQTTLTLLEFLAEAGKID
ncbi:MAG: C_GCAxxG_C_C family protein [Anaerolineae bacterium]|nr:C_GCAxxG_C_C family protein [Anaerolineae bacterium]